MSEDYRTIITTVGQNKFATAISAGPQVALSEMAIGDSNGVGYNPDENQAGLVNEVYRAALDSVEVLAGGVIACTMTVPIDQGGWHVREAAVYDDVGAFLAVVRLADRYKPLPASGQAEELTIKLKMDVGNVGAVTWTVDPDRKDDLSAQIAPDYRSIKALQNDPPADPAPVAGETWIVGNAPTGAWVGREKHLAEWTGVGWVFQAPIAWFHVGMENRTDMRFDQIANDWVEWKASATERGPILIAPNPADTSDSENAITPAQILTMFQSAPFFPEIGTPTHTFAITDNLDGTITINDGQEWIHRGVFRYSMGDIIVGDRTLAHVLNKTYHLRWHAPGKGDATPIATYPNGRLVLKDLADVAYNAGALAETNAAFDTAYDDMLIARVVTDGANSPTITSLFNHKTPIDTVNHNSPDYFLDNIGGVKPNTIILNWGRTPIVARGFAKRSFHEGHIPSGAWDNDWEAEVITLTRYALVYELTCDRTESAPNIDFTFNAL